MDIDRHARAGRCTRQAVVDPVLVDVAGDRNQVREHGIADRCGDLGVGQRVQAHIDDGALSDDLHPIEDRPGVIEVGVVWRQELRDLAAGQLLQQRQEAGDDLVEVRLVVAHRRTQAVQHRVVVARLGEVLLQRYDALLAPDHVARDVLLVELGFDLDDHFPGLGLRLGEVVLGVFDEQRVDVDDMPLDQHVVRALPQFHERAGDDVHEPPRELSERRAVAFAGELPRDACRHFRDPAEAAHGVVAGADLRPTQVEDVELALAARALGFDVHALQEIGIPLGIDDDHDLVLARGVLAPDVLGDEQLGEPRLAHAGGAQHQRMPDALAQRQADVHLVRFDAVQARQTAHGRQRAHRVEGYVPARERGQPGQRERRELQPFLQATRQPVGWRRLHVAAELRPVRLHQPMGVLLLPQEPATHEQPLLADRHVAAGHHVVREAANVAPVAQDDAGIAVADGAVGAERQRAANAHGRTQRERPWGHQGQKRGACTRRDGV
ncbi:hypothetical protein APY03_2517 [Variovorax sp. WDL1]|nr:hypothetical protein APY03_2517 [Variovorax sp. WDL1]